MSETGEPDKQTTGDRKRKRSNEEEETTADTGAWEKVDLTTDDVEMESPTKDPEPPKKRSRRKRHQASTNNKIQSSQVDSSQQLSFPTTMSLNIEEIRRSRREKALRILDEVLPAMVLRLRELHRRSRAAAIDDRGAVTQGTACVDGPWTSAKKRTLVNQLKRLVKAATDLMRQHHELMQEGNEEALAKKKTSNQKRFQKLSGEAENLIDVHMKVQRTNGQREEDDQKRYIEELRLILGHPLFNGLLPDEEALLLTQPPEGDDPATDQDHQTTTPLRDTADLIELVTTEMRRLVECSIDLRQWISLSAPSFDVDTDHENRVRAVAYAIIEALVTICRSNVDFMDEYEVEKAELAANAMEEPLSLDRMRAIVAYDNMQVIAWRRFAYLLALECGHLMDFVQKHMDVLEQGRPRVDTSWQLYG